MATGKKGTAPSTASTHGRTKRDPRSPAEAASPGERGSRPVAPEKSGDKGVASPLAKLKGGPPRKERATTAPVSRCPSSSAIAVKGDPASRATEKVSQKSTMSPRPTTQGTNSGLARSPVGASQPASPEQATPTNAPSAKATPPRQLGEWYGIIPRNVPASETLGKATAGVASAAQAREPRRWRGGDQDGGGVVTTTASGAASSRVSHSVLRDLGVAAACRSPGTFGFHDSRKQSPSSDKAGETSHGGACPAVSSSQCFVGLIMSLVLVIVVLIVLKMLWFQYSVSPNVCLTSACGAYSYRLLQSINTSVDPCRDFTRFVCDGWQRRQNLDVREDQFLGLLDMLDATLKGADIPLEEQRAAILYRSCDDVLQGKKDDIAAVKTALYDAGIVWPQQTRGADAVRALVYSSIKLGWDAVLSFDVTTHPGEMVDELVVDPGSSFHFLLSRFKREESPASKRTYFQFLWSLFAFKGPRNNSAVTYEQMQTIAEPALGNLSLLYDTWDKPRLPADWFANVSSAGLTEARWLEALHNVSVSLRGGLRITTENPDFLATVVGLWTHMGENSFHLFVSWCTVQVAALYANKDSILNYYGQSFEKAQAYHRAFCLSRAAVFFRKAPFASYIDGTLQENKVSIAKEITLSVRLAFSQRLSRWMHFDENMTVVANWSSLDTVFRSFEYNKGENDTYGAKKDVMPVMTDSFVNNWQLSAFVNKPDEVKQLEYAICYLMFYVVRWKRQDFQLMPYSLSVPFFDPDLPASINYGAFGSEIIGPIGSIFVESYREKNASMYLIDCIKRGLSGSETYTDDNVARAVGFGALVDAYKRNNPTASWAIEGLERYTGLELLFMTACFSLCTGRFKAENHECDLLARHVPEFDEAFRCTPIDQRNQSFQCQLL